MTEIRRDLASSRPAAQATLRRLLIAVALGIVLLCALLFALSWQHQASLRTVFDDRVLPLHGLQRIGHALNVSLPAELATAEPHPVALQRQAQRIDGLWQAYLATYLTDEEALLAQRAGERLAVVLAAATGDDAARATYGRSLHGFNSLLGPLLELQVRVAETEMRRAEDRATWALGLALAGVLGGLLLLLRAWWRLQAALVDTPSSAD